MPKKQTVLAHFHANTCVGDACSLCYQYFPPFPPSPPLEEELGEGAALSLTGCTLSFDGLSACGANDTAFINNHAGRKGGALAVGGSQPSYMEFHGCTFDNSSVGEAIEDDPQGEGGALSMGTGTTLVLSECAVTNSYCGKKVCVCLTRRRGGGGWGLGWVFRGRVLV